MQQLKQDMRYRVKVVNLNERHNAIVKRTERNTDQLEYALNVTTHIGDAASKENQSNNTSSRYLIQNWQFEIRKLTYEDAGTYSCLLPLVKPMTKNITLQVTRKHLNFYLKCITS